MRITILSSLCFALAGFTSSDKLSYDGYKVYRIQTGKNLQAVQVKLASLDYELWNSDKATHIDILIPPSQTASFEALGLDFKTMHANLGESIAAESGPAIANARRDCDGLEWFDSYHPYDDHIQYFENLRTSFPNNSEKISSGRSYEGRDIYGLHLWGSGGPGKPAVLYHATVHAREWIAAPVVEYITYQLVTGYKANDSVARTFLDSYDFYILPFVNPDGFIYSQTTDRLWRKNRQSGPGNSTCYGRDINRNWEFAWNATSLGASSDPCSQTYQGEAPSDTPETQGLDTLVRKLRDEQGVKLFIDWHSYGQFILSPYGFNETLYAPELGKWTRAASLVSDTIMLGSSERTTFTFGPSGATLYRTTGAALDHVYSIGGAEFSYMIELRDIGDFGFVLPPEYIRPTVVEQWEGQKLLISLLDEEFFDGIGLA